MCSAHLSILREEAKTQRQSGESGNKQLDVDDLARIYSLSAETKAEMESLPRLVQKIRCRLQAIAPCLSLVQ